MENEIKNVSLELNNSESLNKPLTFGKLFEQMKEEISTYEKSGEVDELMKQPVVVCLYDAIGKTCNGNIVDHIGWLQGGKVLLIGDLTGIYE